MPSLRVQAITLFPFILIKHKSLKNDAKLLRHERIHLWQELELLILPFYILYLINYLVNMIRFKDHDKAYRSIVFEKEAFAFEENALYLKYRPFWAWLKYLKF